MNRIALVVWVVLAGCTRDMKTWPPEEIASLARRCPATLGFSRVCDCYAPEVAKRVPFAEAPRFIEPESPADQQRAAAVALEAVEVCSKGATTLPWPGNLKTQFIAACARRDLTQAACRCILARAEWTLPPEAMIASTFSLRTTGEPTAALVQLFKSAEAAECVLREAKWEPLHREAILAGCKTNERGAEYCECFADTLMAETTPQQMLLDQASATDGEARRKDISSRCIAKLEPGATKQ